MIKFKKQAKFYNEPFNYFEIEDVFDKNTLEKLINEFPDVSSTKSVMGGRRKLEGKTADDWIKGAKTWRSFYNFINTQSVLDFVISKYEDELNYWKSSINSNTKISDCYIHMDWSMAEDGYVREIHCDSNPRFFNFLIFLNDKRWEGGDFQIHSSKKISYYKEHFWKKNLPIERVFEAKKNYGIFFLSTPNSYHSVSKQFNTLEPRKFIYGSISLKGKTFNRKIKAKPNLFELITDVFDETPEIFNKIQRRLIK
jgi:hypothetical protein